MKQGLLEIIKKHLDPDHPEDFKLEIVEGENTRLIYLENGVWKIKHVATGQVEDVIPKTPAE